MGVYNNKNTAALYKSVYSIIGQSYTDWELIICNDGSTDNTASVLAELGKLDARIKIIGYAENKGLAYALNYCLEQAHGRYIARMDDDDVAHKDRLQKQIDFLEMHGEFAFAGSNANVFNEKGIWGILKMPRCPNSNDFLWNIPFIHPSMVFRKSALLTAGGYKTDAVNRRCEDYSLVMELYSLGMRGYNFQEALLDYYIANGNTKYRPMRDRIDEAIVRYRGYKKNGILFRGIPFIIKPLILGLLPQCIFRKIKQWQYSVNR